MSRQPSILRVADYLLKPVNKVEMGNILEKIQHQIQQPSQELANRLDSR